MVSGSDEILLAIVRHLSRVRLTQMITFSIQSGSNGNCIYVEAGDTRLLFDAGVSGKRARERMAEHGRCPNDVDALFISHDVLLTAVRTYPKLPAGTESLLRELPPAKAKEIRKELLKVVPF